MSEDRLRLFVALVLPSQLTEALLRWREGTLHGISGLRLLDSEHLHVTLCFLGWQSTEAADEIAVTCRSAISAALAPELVLGEPVWLPSRRPRVLAVELGDSEGSLAALQSALSASLEDGGWYAPEQRPYLGHVTVARVRRGATLRPVSLPSPERLPFTASRVALFRSRLGSSGARYEALAEAELERAPPGDQQPL